MGDIKVIKRLHPVILDIETTGLDPFTNRIVAIGVYGIGEPVVYINEDEKKILREFYYLFYDIILHNSILIGYNIQNFDIPFMTARTLKHGFLVEAAHLRKAYRADLMTIVTRYLNTKNRHISLRDVAEFFDIDVDDKLTGADIPVLWEQGDYESIKKHCTSDLLVTHMLFKKLQYLVEHNVERRYGFERVILDV